MLPGAHDIGFIEPSDKDDDAPGDIGGVIGGDEERLQQQQSVVNFSPGVSRNGPASGASGGWGECRMVDSKGMPGRLKTGMTQIGSACEWLRRAAPRRAYP